jgi:hypothetical protein
MYFEITSKWKILNHKQANRIDIFLKCRNPILSVFFFYLYFVYQNSLLECFRSDLFLSLCLLFYLDLILFFLSFRDKYLHNLAKIRNF